MAYLLSACAIKAGEGGVIPSRTGQESPEMAKASQQHCGPYGYWTAVDEEQDIGEEVGIFAGGVGWQPRGWQQ